MPTYNSPLVKPQLLQKGVPAYLFGGLDMLQGNAKGRVTNDAIATNVATVTLTIFEGPEPKVGDLITIWGTSNSSGAFNVTRSVLTAVSINGATGSGTVTFPLTGTNQSATADSGAFLVEPGESYETLAAGKSQAVLVQAPEGDSQFTIPMAVTFQTLPTDVTVTLQKAIRDIDGEYTNTTAAVTVATSAYTAGPVVEATLERGYFYRALVSGLTLGSGAGLCVKVG